MRVFQQKKEKNAYRGRRRPLYRIIKSQSLETITIREKNHEIATESPVIALNFIPMPQLQLKL